MRIEGDKDIQILQGNASTDYLGRKLCFGALHDTEVEARLDKAWRKFFSFKAELCGRHVRLTSRLYLFNAVVTPTFLYGGGTWTLTSDREHKIRTTQRRMLRWMLGAGRRKLEPEQNELADEPEPLEAECEQHMSHETWIDWMIRTTGIVVEQLSRTGLDDWVTAARRKNWRWA